MSKLNNDSVWQVALRPLSIARMLWKQKLMVALVWLLLSAAVVVVVMRLPVVYRAEAVISVDSQKIPEKFVGSTVAPDFREQLATVSQQILSGPRLAKIIEAFDLYPEERRSVPIQEVVERMRGDLQVRIENGWTEERPGAFRVTFQGRAPVVLAQALNGLCNSFVDDNLRAREVHAEGTEEFIQGHLAEAKKTLDEQEQRITAYKLEHNGELPEQAPALTALLAQISVQLQGNQEAISRAYSNKATLDSGLRLAEAVAEVSKRLDKKPAETSGPSSSMPGIEKPEDIRKAMEAELATLLVKYTESYPRVQLLRASIARLKTLEEREQLSSALDPEHAGSLKLQVAAIDRELKERTRENQRLLQEIRATQLHLSRIPIREQEMSVLTRDYETSKVNYKSLLDKLNAANMTSDMERRKKAERFTILEPARPPQAPVKPNRPILIEAGEFLALAAALMLGLVLEIRKNHILGEWEIPAAIPIFGRVPAIYAGARTPSNVRVRLRTRGRLDSFFRILMNGRKQGGDWARGYPASVSKAIPSAPVLGSRTPSAALAIQRSSALEAAVRRPVRSVHPESPALWLLNPEPRALEQYRIARTRVEHHPSGPKMIVVSSACSGDGKTISAINLASVFAMRSDVKILLVEADFRRSCLAGLLGIPAQPGLTDVLRETCELNDAIVVVEQLPNLCILPAGSSMSDITEMLDTPAWESLCASLREQFAYIIFDAPPVGPVADYELIEKNCDAVMLVVRPDHTDRTLFRIADGTVLPEKMLGVLLNDVEDWFLWKTSASYYGYGPIH